jgi:beta-glucanase (GH16 family)
MRGIYALFASGLLLLGGCTSVPVLKSSQTPRNETEFKSKWELVWADEFDKAGPLDVKKWKVETGGHGWGNQELQHYTGSPENVRVEDGHLIIEAHKRRLENNPYTSARVNSLSNFTYGRFEVRAKLPRGRGTWPAIWMMPYGNGRYAGGQWPDNGEIDIMEHVGFDQGVVHASLHTKTYNWIIGTQKTGKIMVNDLSDEFHVYALEWTPERMDLFVDQQKYYSFTNPHQTSKEWPFDQPFYFILNVAVGGAWGGKQGVDDSIFPQRMTVDYVRAYRSVGAVDAPLAAQ